MDARPFLHMKEDKAMPSTKTRAVTFISRIKNQNLTMEASEPIFSGNRQIGETQGKRIHFENGQYTTSDPAEIDFIRSRINAPDGAQVFETTPSAPEPGDTLVQLVTANAEQTRLILNEELENWQRPLVIEACEAKLAQFGTRGPKPKTD